MAENKKTIVVYADWKDSFEILSDEEAGKLIKHFFKYVNDENPTAPDRVTELSFIPIKNALKRDLDKWEKKLEDKSINGRIGNLKRWNKDLYLKFEAKEITLEQAEIIAENRKKSHSDKIVTLATKPLQFIAVNDNDSVSVSVNDITSTNVEVEKEKKSDDAFEDSKNVSDEELKLAFLKSHSQKEKNVAPKKESNQDFANSLKFESPTWLENASMQNKKPPEYICQKLDEFLLFLSSTEKNHKSRNEFISHFINWISKKIKSEINDDTQPTKPFVKKLYQFDAARIIETNTRQAK